jgi:hypothetical protein
MRLMLIAGACALACASGAGAQVPTQRSRWQPEVRADAFTGRPAAVHAGAGVALRLGYYARLAVVAGAGMSRGSDASGGAGDTRAGGAHASGRVEVLGRFVLDPFREAARGPYAAAGLSQRLEQGLGPRTRLTAVLGLEGRPRGGWAPSLEAGFGGGVRAGLVLRRAQPDGR